jgi:AcrR family transcriptional regulator
LDVALAIVAEEGVAAVTMGAVAERMRVTRPVVYACFPSRGNMLATLLEREMAAMLSEVMGSLPRRRAGTMERTFVDGFRAFLSVVQSRPMSFQIVLARDPDPILAAAITTGREQIAAQIGLVIRPLLECWQVPELERTLPVLVELCMSIGDGAVRLQLADDGAWTPDSLAEIVGTAAYRALRVRPKS